MPSQLLHTLFCEDVISEIHKRLAPKYGVVADKALEYIQNNYQKIFALGCQGPDIFYHSQGRRPVGLEYGTLLHRRDAGVFCAGLLKMGLPDPPPDEEDIRMHRREKGINALGVYALGYMTHAILDRIAHPYIVYKSDRPPPENTKRERSHAFLERIIDLCMLRYLRNREISDWDQEGFLAVTCENPPLGLKDLIFRALVLAYEERAGKDKNLMARIENTFLDCPSFYRYTAPAYTRGKTISTTPFLKKEQLAYLYPDDFHYESIDFLNLEKQPWFHPAGEGPEDRRSFPEVYADAVDAAADSLGAIIGRYLKDGLFPVSEAAVVIGNGGLSIVDREGKPCAPRLTNPLPLGEVLERQAVIRGV